MDKITRKIKAISGHEGPIDDLILLQNGNLASISYSDKSLRIWDKNTFNSI